MHIEIIKATNKDSFDLSIMTGELLQEIMDKINICMQKVHMGQSLSFI